MFKTINRDTKTFRLAKEGAVANIPELKQQKFKN